jgi:two-component system, NtrC family, sensor histidine kinase HydH
MAQEKTSFRRQVLHLVIVLLVFYPVGLYIYTQSANRAAAEEMMLRSIDGGLTYCLKVKNAVEELLAGPDMTGYDKHDALMRLQARTEEADFEKRVQTLLYSGGVTDTPARYTAIYTNDTRLIHWGHETPARVVGDVVVTYPLDYEKLRKEVFDITARNAASGICRVTLPLDLGAERNGRLVVALVSSDVGSQLDALSDQLSMRALRLSLIGTSLLALLAAYIIYLNDRTRELQLKLEAEKRLAYVGTIAAGMAHEIRNPLSSVKMNIQMIEDRLGQFGEQESGYLATKVARIHRETARLEESVNNFLAFARPKPLDRRWSDLNQAIDHVIDFLEPACIGDDIRLVRDYTADLPQVYIDPEQLGQAVENLIRNAHQAIGRDGIIEIYTGRRGDHIEVRISDNGPGIPSEARDKIFDIFFTTKQGGSGLGLTIVKQIAEAHGGDLSFDTIEKRGTTFTLTLPTTEKH